MVGSKTSILQNSSNVFAKIDDFEARMVISGAQNRPQEDRRGEGTRLRRRYEPKKVSRELQEAPEEAPSHDPSTLSTFYSAKRAGVRVLGHRPSLPLELFALLSDFRSSRSSFGAPIALFFEFCLIILVCGGCENKSIFVRGSCCLTSKTVFMARNV